MTEIDQGLPVADPTSKLAYPTWDMLKRTHIKGLTEHIAERTGRIIKVIRPFRCYFIDCGICQFFLELHREPTMKNLKTLLRGAVPEIGKTTRFPLHQHLVGLVKDLTELVDPIHLEPPAGIAF